jgi:3-oxoacyl-(acyl-carrier-protein) synthase III
MSETQPTITGIGGVLGAESIPNVVLIQRTGISSSASWIADHTGIQHRYWAEDGTLAADLGAEAAQQALACTPYDGGDLSGIYLTTLTPDYLGPYTATEVHKRLEAGRGCFALELTTACSGAVVALSMAADKVTLQPEAKILTVGTEILSRILDPNDRRSAILFGDGAGATVVEGVLGAEPPVFSHATAPDREAIYAPAGGLAEPGGDANDPRRKIQMDGIRVARHALTLMPEVLMGVLQKDGALNEQTGQIDWDRYGLFVPHQANGVLIKKMWEVLKVPAEKRLLTVDQHGNTSSASILLALKKAREDGRLEGHTRILMTSIGAGMIAAAGAMDVRIG